MNFKFEISGEGRRKDITTNSAKRFLDDFHYRLIEAFQVELGYNKTWIKIYVNDKLYISERFDLSQKNNWITAAGFIKKAFEKEIVYHTEQNNTELAQNSENKLLFFLAILSDNHISYKYKYYVNGKLKQVIYSACQFTNEDKTIILKNLEKDYHQKATIIESEYKLREVIK